MGRSRATQHASASVSTPPARLERSQSVGSAATSQVPLASLETVLGHRFSNPEILLHALTHRSLANERAASELSVARAIHASQDDAVAPSTPQPLAETGDNERLEFLGDAVLGLAVAEALFAAHPDWQEGELTRVRAQLVSRKHMAEVALAIGLGTHLRLSRGEDRTGLRTKGTVLSNSMEAVMGALFLDGGLGPVRGFVLRQVMGVAAEQLAAEIRSGAALGNYKSALQEHLQSARAGTPTYTVKDESGPDHRKRFLVEVRLKAGAGEPTQPLARGKGTTKKHAEQDAARRALELLQSGEITLAAPNLGAPGPALSLPKGPSHAGTGESAAFDQPPSTSHQTPATPPQVER